MATKKATAKPASRTQGGLEAPAKSEKKAETKLDEADAKPKDDELDALQKVLEVRGY
jgi:hypothetical protein